MALPARSLPASRHSRRTRPVAHVRPSSFVTFASHTCVLRPRVTGVAVTRNVPPRTAVMNDVEFSNPTTDCPRVPAATAAPVEHAASMIPQCTPPCTIPYGCVCCGPTTSSPMHSLSVALTHLSPIPVFQPPSMPLSCALKSIGSGMAHDKLAARHDQAVVG